MEYVSVKYLDVKWEIIVVCMNEAFGHKVGPNVMCRGKAVKTKI